MKKYKKIPDEYLPEFIEKQTKLFKSRVRLFCLLSVGIYFFATVIGFLLFPGEFKMAEVHIWIFLALSSILVLYLTKRARTLAVAKFNAYLFTTVLVVILTRVCILYPENVASCTTLYLFGLFVVTFTIPWRPVEVFPITLMHILAYSFLFWFATSFLSQEFGRSFNPHAYFEGITFLTMAFVLCLVIRRKETARDIENFILFKDVEKKNEQMQKELELATRVHKTLIPQSISTDLVDIAVTYLPMRYIGGDYTKFHFIDKDRLIFIICDVTGHGVSAALLVNRIHTEFERLAREGREPGILLKELNNFVKTDFRGINMYLSAFCCLLNFKEMKISYSNYAHPSQYLYKVTKSDVQSLGSQAGLLGVPFLEDKVHQNEIHFTKGDRILLFTDGIVEAKNETGEMFGNTRLESLIRNKSDLAVELFNQQLVDKLSEFRGKKIFEDDVMIVGIQVR